MLSPWSVFKGHTEQAHLSLFCLALPPSCKTQLSDCDSYSQRQLLQTMLGGRGLLRMQSGGERGEGGTGGMFENRLGCPTGRVGELGEVGSPLAVKRLHTVICGWSKKEEPSVSRYYNNIY